MRALNIPLVVGYRLLNTPQPMVGFVCNDCEKPHIHPDNGTALQRFKAECQGADRQVDEYDLLICGAVPSARTLPLPGEENEVDALDDLLAAVPRG